MNLLTAAGKWRGGERGTVEAGVTAMKKKLRSTIEFQIDESFRK
jgi:hypothetical protein